MKILIVEDDPDSRLVLRKNLENAGHEVIESVNGKDALEKAGSCPPDLIISDILMPVMDGYKLCHAVKNDDRLRHIPFIFYTATYTDPEDERLAMGLGASCFVLKPVEPEKFLSIIDQVVLEVKNGAAPVPDKPVDEPLTLSRKFESSLSRKLEEKVRQLKLFQRIFDNSVHAIAVVNKNNRIVRQNPAHTSLFGYSDAELWGKTAGFYLPEEEATVILKKITGTGMAAGESPATRKNTKKIFVGYSVFPITDEHSKITDYAWLLHDITEKKTAEKKLRKAHQEWDKTFDAITDVVTLQDMDNRIVRANKAAGKMFDLSQEDIIGKHCYELFGGFSQSCKGCPIPTSFGTALPYTTEIHHAKLDKTFQVSAVPVYDEDGSVQRVAHFGKDITDQKKLEAQYRQAQKMEAVGRLSGGVAHDFNNLLTTILGYSEMAMMDLPKDSKLRDDLNQIHLAGERAAVLTRQLLAFSRKQVLEMRVIDLNRIIDNLVKMLKRLISENIDLQVLLHAEKPFILADPGQVEQIIINLAVNARDAMPEGGTLLIKTQMADVNEHFVRIHGDLQTGPHVLFTVADTGQGISLENQDKIFEPFFTTKEMGKGTGLGLATVYGIVKQHHGEIYVYSEEGEGTTFKVYLPLAEKMTDKAPVSGRKADPVHKGTQTILVVDDDKMVCAILKATLVRLGYTILVARNAASAIKIMEEYNGVIHMMLTDIVMPGMSGVKLAKIVKKKMPDIKVVLMSGYAEEIVRKKDLILPGYNFIEKPVIPSILAHKLRKIFNAG